MVADAIDICSHIPKEDGNILTEGMTADVHNMCRIAVVHIA